MTSTSEPSSVTTHPEQPGRGHVLVVDDSEASRYLTGSWLRRKGFRVTEAASGTRALDELARTPPDLVLLDVNLPDMNGFEVCERIKGDPATAAIPVIHMSATAIEADDRAEGLERGADGYLVEPIDPGVLVATVESALRYHRARAQAERLAERLTGLTRVTTAVVSAPTVDDLLVVAAEGAAALFGGPAVVLTVGTDDRPLLAGSEGDQAPVGALVAHLGSVLGHDVPESLRVLEIDRRSGESWTVVVIRPYPSRVPVCVAVDSAAMTSDEDRNLLLQLGQATAPACESMRALTEERDLALSLQRGLLPRELPTHPRLPMAARYVPATRNTEIGGDFYEVTELDGRYLIAVGDVTGHSITAATVMGEVRHALRAYAVEGHGLVGILDRLDRMIRRFHPRDLTTLCLVLVDLADGTAEVANAGHIPPLLVDGDGARYLTAHGPMLGIGLPRPEPTRIPLTPGALVLLVTDGLIERPGVPLDDGMDALLAAVAHREGLDDLEELSDTLLAHFGNDPQDDIALLAFRRG